MERAEIPRRRVNAADTSSQSRFFNFVNLLGEISDLPYVGRRDISYGTILERKKGRRRKGRKEGAIDRSVRVVYKFLIVYIITR